MIAAAKDAVNIEQSHQIEAVINAGLMDLEGDQLSFNPSEGLSVKAFLTAIAKGLYGADLEIDHLQKALDDGIWTEELVAEDPISHSIATQVVSDISDKLKITAVFATSDIHGNYVPYTSSDGHFQIGSVARIQSLLQEIKAQLGDENVIYVDGGDSPYNTTLANVTNGDVSIAALNALGLDATVLGNHDFDYAFDNLLRLAGDAEYKMLSANTKYKEKSQPDDEDDLYPDAFDDYIVIESQGLKYGVFGITDDQSSTTTLYSNTVDIEWDVDLEKASQVVKQLKEEENCDVIIALSHLHSKNDDLIEQEKDILISIGGGNDIAGRPTILGENQYLVNPGKHGEALTQININIYDGKVLGLCYNQIFLTEAYEEDQAVKTLMEEYNAQVDAALDVTIGYLNDNLEWSSELVRAQSSPIANLVADSLLDFFKDDGATLCIINGGGIRAKLDEGEVSIREVTSVLPFDNNMMLVETTGQTIWKALENGISAYASTNGKFPQVAGMTYDFIHEGEGKNTLTAATLADGSPLDLEAKYKVVINSFLAGGGDGYTMLNVLDSTQEMASDVEQLVYVNKTYLRDALQAYFEKHSTQENPLALNLEEVRINIK